MIEIHDNFLNPIDFVKLNSVLLSTYFNWYYNDETVANESIDDLYDFQFTHVFYANDKPGSEHFNLLTPIFEKLNIGALIRVKANLTTANPTPRSGIFHADFPERKNSTTSIFYLNTTNGGTLFENGDRVDCVENRLITFRNQLRHAPQMCSDSKIRCVINFNYYE